MSIELLDGIIALAELNSFFIARLWLMPDGHCRGCGINTVPPRGANIWTCEHPAACPSQQFVRIKTMALAERAALLARA
jgi:hypothetical protein